MILNNRQSKILSYIDDNKEVSRKDIENFINLTEKASKITVIRDLDILLKNGYIISTGKARGVKYKTNNKSDVLREYNVENYFSKDADERSVKYPQFNFDIFNKLDKIFTDSELQELDNINKQYLNKINNLSKVALKKEFERLLIELSWKSAKIEGNTYSLLDTEALIKDNIEAEGHKKEEAVMILNHKNALEYIFESKQYFKKLSLKKIEELHELLTQNMGVKRGLRTNPVGIVGTNYKPLDNQHQIKEAVERLVDLINSISNPITKALITVLMISYIQPFEDGNKRTGRILANAVLYAHCYCPLSYRSVKETEYKKAVIIFYENNSLSYFKTIFTEQFKFAVEKYF